MAQAQRAIHMGAEAAALVSAVILLFAASDLPWPEVVIARVIAVGIIVVDIWFLFSWRAPKRSRQLIKLHILTECLGMFSGVVMLTIAASFKNPYWRVLAFIFGGSILLGDAWFLSTWLGPEIPGWRQKAVRAAVRAGRVLGLPRGKSR